MLGVPGSEKIALFLIFGLLFSAGWGGLTTLATFALRLGMQETGQDDRQRLAPRGDEGE
jgi:hypothetical protein